MPEREGTARPSQAATKAAASKRATNSSPRTQKKRPGDLTGTRKQRLEKESAEERQARAVEMALASAERDAVALDEVVDYTEDTDEAGTVQELSAAPLDLAEADVVDLDADEDEDDLFANADTPLPEPKQTAIQAAVDVEKRKVIIRVNSPIEDMTFGREVIDPGDRQTVPPKDPVLGNLRHYTFDENRRYKVPVALALHLEELGYLYH